MPFQNKASIVDIGEVRQKIKQSAAWSGFRYRERVDSTNDWLRRVDNPRPGLVVMAETQTKGRGRRGSTWHSPPGGLWTSFLLKVSEPPRNRLISLEVITALREAVEEFGIQARVVWPNDLYARGKKLGGVLVETCGDLAIVGVGLNVNNDFSEMPKGVSERSVSMKQVLDKPTQLEEVLLCLLDKVTTCLELSVESRSQLSSDQRSQLSDSK